MIDVFYKEAYVAAAYDFETTRKAGWVAESLRAQPITGVRVREPASVTTAELELIHAPSYIDRVVDGQSPEALGLPWSTGLWAAVTASTGGVLGAVESALRDGVAGSLSSGLHHARYDHGAGYCTFNGLALAAAELELMTGAPKRVLILDFDAHCGGGTASLIANLSHVTQVDVSTNRYDAYTPKTGSSLDIVPRWQDYIATVNKRLCGAPGADLVLYNAGMDPHQYSPGGLAGVTDEILGFREKLVFEWASHRGVPIAFVLAGGYTSDKLDQAGLVGLHRLTIEAAVESGVVA
jgi:acetoin utilization deacetylase AcuC-like enzyme